MNYSEEQLDNFFEGSSWGAEVESGECTSDVPLNGDGTWAFREYEPKSGFTGVNIDSAEKAKKAGTGKFNLFGGEVQVEPAYAEQELFDRIERIKTTIKHPKASEGAYPSSMHIHIRVPKLLEDPALLKKLMLWSHKWDGELIPMLCPLDEIHREDYTCDEHYQWFKREQKERRDARWKGMNSGSVERLTAVDPVSIKAVMNSLVPCGKNPPHRPVWIAWQRTAVNYSKIRHTETIEFRFHSITDIPEITMNSIKFARRYLECALNDENPLEVFKDWKFQDLAGWSTRFSPKQIERLIRTNVKHNKREDILAYLEEELLTGELKLSELNNPPYWDYLKPQLEARGYL